MMMTQHSTTPKARAAERWQRWKRVARRIRVPLGFLTAAVFLVEVARRPSHPTAIAWSFALVLPGLALRAAASGTVKKNQELTVTGPYAYTLNNTDTASLLALGLSINATTGAITGIAVDGTATITVNVADTITPFLTGSVVVTYTIAN